MRPIKNIFPTSKQWKNWSLPSKLTAIGVVLALIGLIFPISSSLLQIYKSVNQMSGFDYLEIDHIWREADAVSFDRSEECGKNLICSVQISPIYKFGNTGPAPIHILDMSFTLARFVNLSMMNWGEKRKFIIQSEGDTTVQVAGRETTLAQTDIKNSKIFSMPEQSLLLKPYSETYVEVSFNGVLALDKERLKLPKDKVKKFKEKFGYSILTWLLGQPDKGFQRLNYRLGITLENGDEHGYQREDAYVIEGGKIILPPLRGKDGIVRPTEGKTET